MSENITPLSQKHMLVGWGDYTSLSDQVKARTFGHVVRMAGPIVAEYHSDLYWDAKIISDLLDQAFGVDALASFTFAVCLRHSGTHISPVGDDQMAAESAAVNASTAYLFHFTVSVDDRQEWHLSIDLDTAPDDAMLTTMLVGFDPTA